MQWIVKSVLGRRNSQWKGPEVKVFVEMLEIVEAKTTGAG